MKKFKTGRNGLLKILHRNLNKTQINNLPFEVTDVFWMIYAKMQDPNVKLIINQGGTSSSKTYTTLQWLILLAAEKPRIITVVGQDLPNLKVGPMRDMANILYSNPELKRWASINKSESYYTFKNGSIIEFKAYEDAQDAQSGKRNMLFVNEAYGLKFNIFKELYIRTEELTFIDYNSRGKFWAHNVMLYPEAATIITNFYHNKFCSQSVKEKILSYKDSDPFRWHVYGLGLTGTIEEVIYNKVQFIRLEDFPSIEDMEKYGYGLDYGYSRDPMALCAAGVYKGDIYAKNLLYKTGMRTRELIEVFQTNEIDPYDIISMDYSTAQEQADVLREAGYNIKAANRRGGAILSGIGLLQDYYIYIVDDDRETWRMEAENYQWQKKQGEVIAKPVDKYNHLWDALRYWGLECLLEPELAEFSGNSMVF